MKLVWGQMTSEMIPLQSTTKIIVDKQIFMDTKCYYQGNSLKVKTYMKPYNKIMDEELSFDEQIIDFSQTALLLRTLSLKIGKQYSFNSLNPEKNKLNPITIIVLGEEPIQNIDCFKVEINTYEGQAFYWVEKESKYRVIRVEQPKNHQVTELILSVK